MRLTARSARVGAALLLVAAVVVVARAGATPAPTPPDAPAPASPREPSVVRHVLAADVATVGTPDRPNARSHRDGPSTAAVPSVALAAGALLAGLLLRSPRRRRAFTLRRALPGRRAPPLLAA